MFNLYDFYYSYAKQHDHFVQFSHEKSGTVWMQTMVTQIGQIPTFSLVMQNTPLHPGAYIITHLDDQIKLLDNVKYILIVRDPRDCIPSFNKMNIKNQLLTNEVWSNRQHISDQCKKWESYFTCGLLEKDIIIIQYERLCLYPLETLNKVVVHLEIPIMRSVESVVLEYDMDGGRGKEIKNPDWSYYNIHCNKWQQEKRLPDWYNNYIYSLIGDTMLHYGYQRNGHSKNLVLK